MTGSRSIVLIPLLLAAISAGTGAPIFQIEAGIYQNGTININDIALTNGTVYDLPNGSYQITVTDVTGEQIYNTRFPVDFVGVGSHPPVDNGSGSRFTLKVFHVPYTARAETLQLSRHRTTLVTADLPAYLCIKDEACLPYCRQPGRHDPDCGGRGLPMMPIAVALGIVLLGTILYFSIEPG